MCIPRHLFLCLALGCIRAPRGSRRVHRGLWATRWIYWGLPPGCPGVHLWFSQSGGSGPEAACLGSRHSEAFLGVSCNLVSPVAQHACGESALFLMALARSCALLCPRPPQTVPSSLPCWPRPFLTLTVDLRLSRIRTHSLDALQRCSKLDRS